MLIPMDYEGQSDHLKAYGLVYEAIASGYDCHWLLNYRGGSFAILDGDQNIIEKACVRVYLTKTVGPGTAKLNG